MNCPKCGDPRTAYTERAPKSSANPRKKEKTWVRKNFLAKCKKCGLEFDASQNYDVIPSLKEKAPVIKREIKMKYGEDE